MIDFAWATPGVDVRSTLPDTGIVRCYAYQEIPCQDPGDAFYGQDAQYVTNTMHFTDNSNGTITDDVTGLMWRQEDDDVGKNWEESLIFCESLDLGGHTDWRLPDIKEIRSIADNTRFNPGIDTTYFPGTDWPYWLSYWSSSTLVSDDDYAWGVTFDYGNVSPRGKHTYQNVRCVR